MNLITSDVMKGLVGAASQMKQTDAAMRVYTKAKAENDEDKMKRALERVGSSMESVKSAVDEISQAINEAQDIAKAQETAELQQAIQSSQKAAVPQVAQSNSAPAAAVSQAPVQKVYTAQGGVKAVSPQPNVSVTV